MNPKNFQTQPPPRYGRLTLDLANQLVSTVHMEDGAANVVVYLIEAAARAGARDVGDTIRIGAGGVRSSRRVSV